MDGARRIVPPRNRADLEGYAFTRGASLELMAGNLHRAEELARAACADLERQGLIRHLSSELMCLVDALSGLGKLDEAQAHLERAAPMAGADDVDAHLR